MIVLKHKLRLAHPAEAGEREWNALACGLVVAKILLHLLQNVSATNEVVVFTKRNFERIGISESFRLSKVQKKKKNMTC